MLKRGQGTAHLGSPGSFTQLKGIVEILHYNNIIYMWKLPSRRSGNKFCLTGRQVMADLTHAAYVFCLGGSQADLPD